MSCNDPTVEFDHKLIGFLHSFKLRVRELSRIALKHGHNKALA